ncbi:MAG TPA: VOC family protein [Acidimicrobiales bacterium]|nr:VOC family protein [Acidimicrobiales bacterium]
MTCDLWALCIDAKDPPRLARFWSVVLGWETVVEYDGNVGLIPSDDTGFRITFQRSDEEKVTRNQMHFDLTSRSSDDQQRMVEEALHLGAHHLDIGQGDVEHVVLADPEGNEFCVIEPGNTFLADCGLLGAIAGDGSQRAGYFWSEALGWPLVWDQDEETAIRSPRGGPKITWGGPPLTPKSGKYRLHFDLVPEAGASQEAEVQRLISLGATRADIGQGEVSWLVMNDPDGHEFCVLSPR